MFEIVPKIKIHGDYVRMQDILGSHLLLTLIPTGNLSHLDFRIVYILYDNFRECFFFRKTSHIYAKFCENKPLWKWANHSVVY